MSSPCQSPSRSPSSASASADMDEDVLTIKTPSPNRFLNRLRKDTDYDNEDDIDTSNFEGPSKAMSGVDVAKDESRMKKVLIRVGSGGAILATFLGLLYSGHIYVCGLVALIECLLVRNRNVQRHYIHG